MAQTKMICPFSQKACVECSFYRGRHYFLCHCRQYRGYLGEKNKDGSKASPHPEPPFAHSQLPEFAELVETAKKVAKENRWEGLIAGG